MIQKVVEIVCQVEGIDDYKMKSVTDQETSVSNEFNMPELSNMI